MKLPETILITGANGQAAVNLASALLKKKCKLLLITHDRTERIDKLIARSPEQCWLEKCDLNSHLATRRAIRKLIKASGQTPQGLVHLAAIRSYDAKPLSESNPAFWLHVATSNIVMAYNVLINILPLMEHMNKGKVVLFGSNVTRTGLPFGSAYAASKAALSNLVRSVGFETAGHNVQINMVSPAPLDTVLEEDYKGAYLQFRQRYFESYRHSHPAKKLVPLNDVTKAVMRLLDLEETSLTGEEIYLTGGVL
jgi:2,3-dihydro-2,3-dihydroxybenzoate dehydrogenase